VTQAPRKFVDDYDAGMQMTTWPRGGKPEPGHDMIYAGEVMTGFEYSTAASMIQCGMLEEGLRVARAIHDRYDGRERTGLTGGDTASWGYSGNPFGDDECGKYYARAMSSWSLLLACQGFTYDGPAGRLGFRPVWQPADHRSFFTAAEGYGLLGQTREPERQTERVEVRSGRLALRTLVFEAPAGARVTQATVRAPGGEVKVTVEAEGEKVTVSLAQPVVLTAGQELTVELVWEGQ
jgi:hypothetical protein